MAVRTETVQFHSCDLCGQDTDEADLIRLYGPLVSGKRAQGLKPGEPRGSADRGDRVRRAQARLATPQ